MTKGKNDKIPTEDAIEGPPPTRTGRIRWLIKHRLSKYPVRILQQEWHEPSTGRDYWADITSIDEFEAYPPKEKAPKA